MGEVVIKPVMSKREQAHCNSMEQSMTPKEFAKMCRDTLELHEASYDGEWKYAKSTSQAAEEACPKPWAPIIACLLTSCYADVWEWCDEVEKGE